MSRRKKKSALHAVADCTVSSPWKRVSFSNLEEFRVHVCSGWVSMVCKSAKVNVCTTRRWSVSRFEHGGTSWRGEAVGHWPQSSKICE
jgi:hypothetical protein